MPILHPYYESPRAKSTPTAKNSSGSSTPSSEQSVWA